MHDKIKSTRVNIQVSSSTNSGQEYEPGAEPIHWRRPRNAGKGQHSW